MISQQTCIKKKRRAKTTERRRAMVTYPPPEETSHCELMRLHVAATADEIYKIKENEMQIMLVSSPLV